MWYARLQSGRSPSLTLRVSSLVIVGIVACLLTIAGCSGKTDGILTVRVEGNPYFSHMAIDRDGGVWLSNMDIGDPALYHVTAAGKLTTYPLPAGTESTGVVVALDDSAWFTASTERLRDSTSTALVIRVTATGKISTYRVPFDIGGAETIAINRDGIIAMTSQASKLLILLDTRGRRRSKATHTTYIDAVFAGDGSLVGVAESEIVVTGPAGVAHIELPPACNLPMKLAVANGMEVYYLDQHQSCIGKVILGRHPTHATVVDSGGSLMDICADASGQLWYIDLADKTIGLERDGKKVAVVDTNRLTGFPQALAGGTDGSIWVAVNRESGSEFLPNWSSPSIVRISPAVLH